MKIEIPILPKRRKRDTTILDRAVLRFKSNKRNITFSKIYKEIYPVVRGIACQFRNRFPDRNIDDLIQEGLFFVRYELIPIYDIKRAGFKTLVSIGVKQKFIRMISEIRAQKRIFDSAPTFTEYEFRIGKDFSEIPDGLDIMNEILVSDFLALFKERLSKESWKLYKKLYKDPKQDFRKLAKKMRLSIPSLYRKCRSIYEFLKMLMERVDNEK
jgi:hypothetical protein